MFTLIKFVVILLINYILNVHGYEIPKPNLEILSPKGFRISIPSEPNIAVFAFHGAINRPLHGTESGDFSGESLQSNNNQYVYENLKEYLLPGDTLYYWIHVQRDNKMYSLMDQHILIENNKNVIQTTTTTATNNPSFYFVLGHPNPQSINTNLSNQIFNPQSFFNNQIHNPFFAQQQPIYPNGAPGSGSIFDYITTQRPMWFPFSITIPNSPQDSRFDKIDCVQSKTIVRGQHVCSGELIFQDSFDILNLTIWQREIKMPLDTEDAEFISYQDRPKNSYISDGKLYIVPTLLTDISNYNSESIRIGEIDFGSKCTGIVDVDVECHRKAEIFRILPPIVSAKIRTKDSFSFLYGRVEVRAKLPMGDWIFPQIFLEPLTNSYGITGFASGQMRVAYNHGNEILETRDGKNFSGNQLFGGVVLSNKAKLRDIWLHNRSWGKHLNRNFHVYSLTWTDQTITLAIDGEEYAVLRGGFKQAYTTHNISHALKWETGGFMAPFDKEFYLSLGVSVGGISDFPDRSRTGSGRIPKPWFNLDPKAELRFWNDRNNWYETWDEKDSGLVVDYIKVWAL